MVKLKSIKDILEDKYIFFIPDYQRGYRWDKEQVKDLLNDFYEFYIKENKNDSEFYCLQPLVLKYIKENNYYEVIDGQQRLTTIFILLYFLGIKNAFTIKYHKRNTDLDNIDKIIGNENIDFEYIKEAYDTIKDWFCSDEERKSKLKELLLSTNRNVKFIWYQPEYNSNGIEIFVRINIGKIYLTNSELIKALFLQKINFGEKNEYYKERQIEIANEWDFIENALQDDSFWGFISNDIGKKYNRIDYIFDLILEDAKKSYKSIIENIGNDDYRVFRYLYEKWKKDKISFVEREWEKVRNYFYAINKWYSGLKLYHYIGYIVYFNNKNIEKIISEIYNIYRNNLKSDFEIKLIDKIKDVLNIDKDKILDLNYSENKGKIIIRKTLLLYNIEYMIKNNQLKSRFPFDIFKKEEWDIEHIESQTPNSNSDKDSQKKWLRIMLDYYIPKDTNEEIINNIKQFIEDKNKEITFDKLRENINKISKYNLEDEYKDSIGNLVLLDSKTNRSYKNSYFVDKRKIIINKDKEGKFIPICTKNAFLKYFDDNPNSSTIHKWTKDNMEKYSEDIVNILKGFFK